MSNHFGILNIKRLWIFLKNVLWNLLLFFIISAFKLTPVNTHLYINVQLFFNCQRINYIKTWGSKHASTPSTRRGKHAQAHQAREHLSRQARKHVSTIARQARKHTSTPRTWAYKHARNSSTRFSRFESNLLNT